MPTYLKLPRAVNPLYTGREELSLRLSQAFAPDPNVWSKRRKTFVITGLGGTGKSEACLKYTEDHQEEYVTRKSKVVAC